MYAVHCQKKKKEKKKKKKEEGTAMEKARQIVKSKKAKIGNAT